MPFAPFPQMFYEHITHTYKLHCDTKARQLTNSQFSTLNNSYVQQTFSFQMYLLADGSCLYGFNHFSSHTNFSLQVGIYIYITQRIPGSLYRFEPNIRFKTKLCQKMFWCDFKKIALEYLIYTLRKLSLHNAVHTKRLSEYSCMVILFAVSTHAIHALVFTLLQGIHMMAQKCSIYNFYLALN